MNSPSPLVPQGAIPPKTTSRPQRVLMIAAMVVGLHVAGLSLVLFQGCGKNDLKQTASNTETNTTPAMGYPTETNMGSSMFASANTNTGGVASATPAANTNLTPAPAGAFGTPTAGTPGVAAGFADQGIATPPTPVETPVGPTKEYKVQKGETLSAIASKNGVSLSAIAKANPGLDPKKLKVGQPIKIPAAATPTAGAAGTGSTPPTTMAGAATATGGTTAPPIGAAGTYKVKSGDTLTKIAKAHGITVNQLRAANNMKTTQVQVGKVLKIPARTQKTAAAPTNTASTH